MSSGASGLVLGIETSCDETAAAVVRRGTEILSNTVASQISVHSPYGGVVPELASREHLRNILPVVRAALAEAGVTYEDIDGVAVTEGPGLAGALLVGISFAKSLAFALGKPLIAVNHLEGHIHAVLLEEARRATELDRRQEPGLTLALVVSGGHTHLYLAEYDAEAGQLDVSQRGADGGRCGRRGVRQGGEAAGAGISGRAVDRCPRAAWES
jgi:N6-L-threonylcarbamoyladenine synthase